MLGGHAGGCVLVAQARELEIGDLELERGALHVHRHQLVAREEVVLELGEQRLQTTARTTTNGQNHKLMEKRVYVVSTMDSPR
jgi:hypothetical protein